MGKTVIFGGTFNPIHKAHLQIITETTKLPFVDKILVIPTKIPPHKEFDNSVSGEIRLEMCKAAVKNIPKAECSDIELNMPQKSYTVNTLNELIKKEKFTDYAVLIGGDMLESFEQWYCYEEIIKKAALLVVRRNTDQKNQFEKVKYELEQKGAEIYVLNINTLPFSSTEIRTKLQNGEDVTAFLTEEVINFINVNKLYRRK